jgi:hypothetical protein
LAEVSMTKTSSSTSTFVSPLVVMVMGLEVSPGANTSSCGVETATKSSPGIALPLNCGVLNQTDTGDALGCDRFT